MVIYEKKKFKTKTLNAWDSYFNILAKTNYLLNKDDAPITKIYLTIKLYL